MKTLLFSILFYICFAFWIVHEAVRRLIYWSAVLLSEMHVQTIRAQEMIAGAMKYLFDKVEKE